MRIKFLLLLSFAITTAASYGQQTVKRFADSAFAYHSFVRGGTTANIQANSRMVDTLKDVTRIPLDKLSLDTLNFLTNHVKGKRHYQQKVGGSVYYASIVKDGKKQGIAIVRNFAIIDLDKKKQFVFNKTPYEAIFRRFVKRIYP